MHKIYTPNCDDKLLRIKETIKYNIINILKKLYLIEGKVDLFKGTFVYMSVVLVSASGVARIYGAQGKIPKFAPTAPLLRSYVPCFQNEIKSLSILISTPSPSFPPRYATGKRMKGIYPIFWILEITQIEKLGKENKHEKVW